MSKTLKQILTGLGALVAALVLLYVLRAPILTGMADVLIVDDAPRPADIIFVLNGEVNTRPYRAGELMQQCLAGRIVIARVEDDRAVLDGLYPNETDVSLHVLAEAGVAADKITVLRRPGGVTSTFDEANALRSYVQEQNVRSVLLVTSSFHARRARWIMTRQLAGLPVRLIVVAVPDYEYGPTNWWHYERGLLGLVDEYVKLVYYHLKYL